MNDNTWELSTYGVLAILVVVITGLVYLLGIEQSVHIDYEKTAEDYSSLLLTLSLVALVAERFVDVLLAARRAPGKKALIRASEVARAAAVPDPEAIAKADNAIDDYRAVTEKQAMRISLFVGILVALAGVHVLGEILDATELDGAGRTLFISVDALLTAGLIAGGAKGISKISSALSKGLEGLGGGSPPPTTVTGSTTTSGSTS